MELTEERLKKLEPLIEEIKKKYGEKLFFERVNVIKNPELAERFEVKASMTFLFFKHGELVNRAFGKEVEKVLKGMLA